MVANSDVIDLVADNLEARLHEASIASWEALIADLPSETTDTIATNKAWFIREVANCRKSYLLALNEMRCRTYYDAWFRLERIELALIDLARNPIYDGSRFELKQIKNLIERWQSIFPYKLFASPEIVIKAEECSVCSAAVDPWSDCGHDVGRLYDGKICYRIVRDMDLISVAIVEQPLQKMAVVDPDNPNLDFSPIDYVLRHLPSAFFEWNVERTRVSYPIEDIGSFTDDEDCPCGSREQYATCCKGKSHISLLHLEFWFGGGNVRDVEVRLPK